MKTLLRQYVLKKPVLFICLLALRSTPCPSLLCCVLQRLLGPNISKHPYQAPLTTVLSAVFGQWAMLARLWRTRRWTKPGLIFLLLFFSYHFQQLFISPQWFKLLLHSPGSWAQNIFFPVFL